MIFKGQTISHIEGLANTLEQKVIDSEYPAFQS